MQRPWISEEIKNAHKSHREKIAGPMAREKPSFLKKQIRPHQNNSAHNTHKYHNQYPEPMELRSSMTQTIQQSIFKMWWRSIPLSQLVPFMDLTGFNI